VAVAADGAVGVTYYDFRNDCPGDGELTTDVWFSHSHDRGATWDVDQRSGEAEHVAGPFDMRSVFDPTSPETAFGLAAFNGLAALPRGFAASFVQALPGAGADCVGGGCTLEPPTDVFFARVFVPGQGEGGQGEGAKSTGGGWLADRAGGKINFGYTARETAFGFEGELELNDKGARVKIHLADVTSVGPVAAGCGSFNAGPSSLELRGSGSYNGAAARFRVCVQDGGEPGEGVDRFSLACTVGCSYTTGSTARDDLIDGGNIQVGQGGGEQRPATVILDPLLLSEASIGQALTLTVRVYDQDQEPLANTSVTLTKTTSGGGVESLSAVTGADGRAAFLATTLAGVAEYRATAGNAESNAIELTPLLG
jgi:hypothetical protein